MTYLNFTNLRRCCLLLCLVAIQFMATPAHSQCTPVDCPGFDGLFPFGGLCDTIIPLGTVNTSYSEQTSFRVTNACFKPSDFDPDQLAIDVKINTIKNFVFSGLPAGLLAATDQPSYSTSSGLAVGCASIVGTPTEAGTFAASIDVLADLSSYPFALFGPCTGSAVGVNNQAFNFSLDLVILPDPSFNVLAASYCQTDGAVTLTPSGTTGGTFSGPGVSGNSFDPAVAGVGVHTIKYVVSAQEGAAVSPATDSSEQVIEVINCITCSDYSNTETLYTCDVGEVGTVIDSFLTFDGGCDSVEIVETVLGHINDDCANAIPLTVGAACVTDTFSNLCATSEEPIVPDPSCGAYRGSDVWFTAVVPASGQLRVEIDLLESNSAVLEIYRGSCGSLVSYLCSAFNVTRTINDPAIAGETLYIRTWKYNDSEGGAFSICVYEPPIPSNDNCADALFVPAGTQCNPANFTNAFSTEEDIIPNPGCGAYQSADVWFKTVVPASGEFRVEIDENIPSFNISYALYSGDCNGFNQILCDGLDPANTLFIPEFAGDTVYLQFWTYNSDEGNVFDLCFWEPPIPANDSCISSITLPVNNECINQTFDVTYTTEEEDVVGNPSCGAQKNADVWFDFVMPESGELRIEITENIAGFNASYALYTGTCGNFTQIFCDGLDDENTIVDTTLAGQTIYLRVWPYNSEDGAVFDVCLWDPSVPENNDCEDALALDVFPRCLTETYNNNYATAQPEAVSADDPGCGAYRGGDIWFTAVMPYTGELIIAVEDLGPGNPEIAVYTGTCGNFTLVECVALNDNDIEIINPSLIGETLYIRSWSYNNEDGMDFNLCAIGCIVFSDTIRAETCIPAEVGTVVDSFISVDGCDSLIVTITEGDTIPPIAACTNITAQLNSSGLAVLNPNNLDAGSTDNCQVSSFSVSPPTLSCSDIGTTSVTLTVADEFGNQRTCSADVILSYHFAQPGFYFDTTECTAVICPPGSYCPGGTFEPLPCAAGFANNQSGQAACAPCAAGTFAPFEGQTECDECVPGSFQANTGATDCDLCPPGRSQSQAGATECVDCAPGSFSETQGSIVCENCPVDTYSDTSGATECLDCPAGTNGQTGSASCIDCPPGTEQDPAGQGCIDCAAGTFSNGNTNGSCTDCPPGTISQAGSNDCDFCPPGSQASADQTSCELCPPGTYSPGNGQPCLPCAAGTVSELAGAVACSACPDGTEANIDQTACDDCPAGTYSSASTNGQCTDCPPGTVSSIGSGQCDSCPPGTQASTDQTSCESCPPGTFSGGFGQPCTPCAAGTVSEVAGSTSCTACPDGTTANVDQTSCDECPAGTFSNGNTNGTCTDCPPGTISQAGSNDCDFCPPGSQVSADQTSCELCPPGTYSPGNGQPCLPCAAGTVSELAGAVACSACPDGTEANIDQTACDDCPAGTYSSDVTNGDCTQCPTGMVSDAGSAQCDECPPGSQASADQTTCELCPPGTYSPGAGQPCLPCAAGTVSEVAGAVACVACPDGTTANAQQTACDDCPAGTYSSDVTNGDCTQCPTGMVSDAGSAQCDECPPGSQASADQTTCELCPPGTYSPGAGQPCLPCGAGTFSGSSGAAACDLCPAGTFNPQEGAISCEDCPVGTDSEPGSTSCSTCAFSLTCPAGPEVITASDESCGTFGFDSRADASSECGVVTITYDPDTAAFLPVGTTTVEVVATDEEGNTDTCYFDVVVVDETPPVAVCRDVTVNLDANGEATITAGQLDGGSSDNCSVSLALERTELGCPDAGIVQVELYAFDEAQHTDTCVANVTVFDVIQPQAVCQDVTVYLDGNGQAEILPADIDNGSSDECGVAISVSPASFDCADRGQNMVTLGVTDAFNIVFCTATVTVLDTIPPTISCSAPITVSNDPESCEAFVDVPGPEFGDNCLTDNSMATILGVSTPGDLITDENQLGAFDQINIDLPTGSTVLDVDVSVDVSHTYVSDMDLGILSPSFTTVLLLSRPVDCSDDDLLITFDDEASTTAITLENWCMNTAPWFSGSAQPLNALSNFDGEVASGLWTFYVQDFAEFDNGVINSWSITIAYNDPNGRAVAQTFTSDLRAERQVAIDLSHYASISAEQKQTGMDPVHDRLAPGDALYTLTNDYTNTDDASAVYPVGTTFVTWTLSMDNGDEVSCVQQVNVEDGEDPVALCQDITIQLDGGGSASVSAGQVDGGSTDNCGITGLSISPSIFGCPDLDGPNTIVLTVTDAAGNTGTCNATVTLTDPLGACGAPPTTDTLMVCLSPNTSQLVCVDEYLQINTVVDAVICGNTGAQFTPVGFTCLEVTAPADPVRIDTICVYQCDEIRCDTTIIIIKGSYEVFVTETSCFPADTGTVVQLLEAENGCDSIVTTVRTLLPSYDILINETSCFPQDTGRSVQQLETALGCDSVVTTVTTLLPSDAVTVFATTCDPNQPQEVIEEFENSFGCDSIVTTIYELLDSYDVLIERTSCFPQDTGTVVEIFDATTGCDSVVTTVTTLLPSDAVTVFATTCDPNQPQEVIEEFENSFGCDSIVTTIYELLDSYDVLIERESCFPQDTGTVVEFFEATTGCDSVVTTVTTLLPSDAVTVFATTCDPNQPQEVIEEFENSFGCDSIVTTIYELLDSYDVLIERTSCFPQDTGTVVEIFEATTGCDSVVTTVTTLLPSDAVTVFATTCDPNQPQEVIEEFENSFGCDSIVTTIYELLEGYAITVFAETCDPDEAGTVVETFQASNGCDSVITYVTELLESYEVYIENEVCDPAWAGPMTTTYTAQNGCDSIVTVFGVYVPIEADFEMDIDHYTVQFNSLGQDDIDFHFWWFGDFQWSFDANPEHTYSFPGIYLVKHLVWKEECNVDLEIKLLFIFGRHNWVFEARAQEEPVTFLESLKAYPNPTSGSVMLDIELSKMTYEKGILQVIDLYGRTWRQQEVELIDQRLELRDLPPGSYSIRIILHGEAIEQRIILLK